MPWTLQTFSIHSSEAPPELTFGLPTLEAPHQPPHREKKHYWADMDAVLHGIMDGRAQLTPKAIFLIIAHFHFTMLRTRSTPER